MPNNHRPKNKDAARLPVDKSKWGINDNTYSTAPDFYYDHKFSCIDCGEEEVWTAKQQKNWYEELGKTVNSTAVRCQTCRAHIQALREDQKRHMEEMKSKSAHGNLGKS